MEDLIELEQKEIELDTLVHRLFHFKAALNEILSRYQVEKSDEIEKLIESGEIDEHPAYEDFLEAAGYEAGVLRLRKKLTLALQKL
ncbi:hypothetical protein IBX65_01745 [Candidatus Aerophobetes bacterium]|nr:hypothetical protein [Candidatus Aerophobetes bacterium]